MPEPSNAYYAPRDVCLSGLEYDIMQLDNGDGGIVVPHLPVLPAYFIVDGRNIILIAKGTHYHLSMVNPFFLKSAISDGFLRIVMVPRPDRPPNSSHGQLRVFKLPMGQYEENK